MASIDRDIANYLQDLTLVGVSLLDRGLGRGAYGRVFTVSYQGITYAAKEIHSLLITYASQEEKQTIKRNFLRECYYCSKLCHPNIVSFKGVYFPDSNTLENSFSLPVMVMELMDESLTRHVEKQVIDMETKLTILHDVSCGLNYLHTYKPEPIIHRDLSPNNILLVSHRQKLVAKISDLGVAKAVKVDSQATKSVLTKAPGTVDFMAPESLEENPQYTTSLDIFSYAGIVLHVVNQEWPTPISQVRRDPKTNMLTALSEVERRQKYLDKMSSPAAVLEPLVVASLNNDPDKRPAAAVLVKILEYLMENQKTLDNTEISVKSTGTEIPRDQFCFVNLNSGLKMSELLVCYLKAYTKIGRPDAEVQQDIQLKGLGIQPEHCVVEVVDPEVFITPLPAARTLVNGKVVTEKTKLCHGYRVLLGNNHFFRLSCPKRKVVKSSPAGGNKTGEGQQHTTTSVDEEMEIALNYDFAMKEVILNELNSVGEPVATSPPAGSLRSHSRPIFSPMLEAEWELENSQRVMDTYSRANTLVREANMLSQAMDKDTILKVIMQIPPSLLSPMVKMGEVTRCGTLFHHKNIMQPKSGSHFVGQKRNKINRFSTISQYSKQGEGRYHQAGGNEIAVRVLQKARGTDSVWSMETLEEKVVAMRELFQLQEDEKYPIDNDTTMDPFFDIEQHVLLGVANIFTQCLYHRICHEYDAPIIGPTGKVCGSLKLSLERVLVEDVDGEEDTDTGPTSGWEVLRDPEGELAVGSQIGVKIHVMKATGLPSAYCHFVFGQYKFWGQSEPTTLAPLHVFSPAKSDKLFEGELNFDHTQVFTVEVTEDFLDYLEFGTLSVEVYGHRRTGITNEYRNAAVDEVGQHRSFSDRCCEIMKNLEMWVGILELNDQGSYVPVSIEECKDVKTGGVYVLRQGQSRRIQVKINPVVGSGDSPLECSHITSIGIGSVYVRHRAEEPLDSYQDIDLDRLRGKWADALMKRRDHLDKELHKIMEKIGRTKFDTEKEQELIDQWTMLLLERSAVLQPKPGSGVPGAPTRYEMSSGMEPRLITLYLDLNDDMLTACDDEDPEAAIATAPLLGEKDDCMINLALVKNNEAMPEATASWDSSVHDAPGLNCTTANNDRVYAILKVSVMLKHPPGIELVLRKRICLRVIKKLGFGTSLMKLFSSYPTHTQTGAMYEVVTGIPKLEGMFRPPKIPSNHPSFVVVEENENVVEKFKEGMMSVRNILALDRLKQEVCLKEKLAKSGQLIHPAHNNSNQPEDIAATGFSPRRDPSITGLPNQTTKTASS